MVQITSPPLDLRSNPASVGQARRFAASFARTCQLDGLTEDLQLITSELVSNAVRHAGDPITVVLICDDDRLRVEVSDDGRGVPMLLAPGVEAETGRGLVIVAGIAERWGARHEEGDGKTVWAELGPVG